MADDRSTADSLPGGYLHLVYVLMRLSVSVLPLALARTLHAFGTPSNQSSDVQAIKPTVKFLLATMEGSILPFVDHHATGRWLQTMLDGVLCDVKTTLGKFKRIPSSFDAVCADTPFFIQFARATSDRYIETSDQATSDMRTTCGI